VHLTCTHLWQSSHDTALLVEIITHILHTDILVVMILFLYAWEWVEDEHRRISAKIVELQVSLLVFSSPDPKGHVSYCHH
jgi:hypothetical protein